MSSAADKNQGHARSFLTAKEVKVIRDKITIALSTEDKCDDVLVSLLNVIILINDENLGMLYIFLEADLCIPH